MEKPTKHTIQYYDYHECSHYLEKKYSYIERDYARTLGTKTVDHFKLYQKTTGDYMPFGGKYPDMSGKHKDRYTVIRDGQRVPATKEEYDADFKLIHEHFQRYCKWEEENPEQKIPHQDFWHFVLDCDDTISNGSMFVMSDYWLEYAEEDWQKTILEYYLSEFGEGKYREIEFKVSW